MPRVPSRHEYHKCGWLDSRPELGRLDDDVLARRHVPGSVPGRLVDHDVVERLLPEHLSGPLDPGTGQPLAQGEAGGQGGSATPARQPSAADTAKEILSGAGRIEKLAEAVAYLAGEAGETFLGAIEPVGAILDVIEMIWETLKAMATEERGCRKRAWCYTVLYGALDLGAPPEPSFQGSLQGPDQDRLDQKAWNEGVGDGQQDLSNGTDGVALRNKLLLRVAHDGDPSTTLNALWQMACQEDDDTQLAQAYPSLNWPQPTGA